MASVTLAALQSRVWAQLDGNTRFYPEPEVTRAINDGLQQLNLFTGFSQGTVSLTTETNGFFYSLPGSVITPIAVYLAGRQLRRSSFSNLAGRRQLWLSETSANYGPPSIWVPVGTRTIAIHPADNIGGKTLLVAGILEPTLLVSGTDTLDLPDEMADAVQDLAVLALQMKEGGAVFYMSTASYVEFQKQVELWMRWRDLKQPRWKVERQAVKKG